MEIDLSKKLKKSYSLKNETEIKITGLNPEGEIDFLEGVSKVVATNKKLSVYLKGSKKPLVFTNISDPTAITLKCPDAEYSATVQAFYDQVIGERQWLKKPQSTKATGTLFDETIDLSGEGVYVPTAKNAKKKVGVKISAGAGKDTITGTAYNDTLTGGAGADTFVFNPNSGKDTITDASNEDKIQINGVDAEDLRFRKTGNNLEVFYDSDFDDNNKIVIKNYFKKKDATKRVDTLIVGEDQLKLSEQVYEITGSKKINGTDSNDIIRGSKSADTIKANGGNDVIYASKGNDKIYGGDGNDTYIYDGFTDYTYKQKASLGHDTIYNSGGEDTISIRGLDEGYDIANYFEPNPIFENHRVYPEYQENMFNDIPYWVKSGNNLILSSGYGWKRTDTNTITLKDYFKAGKDGFGVKYVDNGEAKYVEDAWSGDIVRNENYESINILDNAALLFDPEIGTGGLSGHLPNNFTGTFMNDIIKGSSKPDVLRGGDGNDIIYGRYANDYKGKTKDKLYGDEGNDTIFSSDSEVFGGTGNDIYVASCIDGADILSDEAGYDRLSLMQAKYATYFDIEINADGSIKSMGDIYIKDISVSAEPVRNIVQSSKIVKLDENGRPAISEYDGKVIYEDGGEVKDSIIARYAGRPAFEVSDAYYELLKKDPSILEDFRDYDGEGDNYNKRFIDGHTLANYTPKEGYKLVFADWDFYVRDYDYTYHGTDVTAQTKYDNYQENQYPANYLFQADDKNNVVGTKTDKDYAYAHSVYNLNSEKIEVSGLRTILKNADAGIVIKNGTKSENVIETITVDREYRSESNDITVGSVDNMSIGDYSQEKVNTVAGNVAAWLKTEGFTSVKDVIQRGTDAQLTTMLEKFDGVYKWTENVKFRSSGYATSEKLIGTNIVQDDTTVGITNDYTSSIYKMGFTHEDRASMLSDVAGDDTLILDYDEGGYSFLFDVEVDKNGKLLNYSRDFYVKFKGEEEANTGLTICYGRETRHAIESVLMNYEDSDSPYKQDSETGYISENRLFTYDQDVIDEVRQNVAGWLYENHYGSVQDVLHSGKDADVASMMEVFAPINNYQAEL